MTTRRRRAIGGDLQTWADVAAHVGSHERTVRRWAGLGLPRPPTTREAVAAWLASRPKRPSPEDDVVEMARDAAPARVAGRPDDLTRWSADYRKARALNAMLDFQRRRGLVVPREDVERLFVERVLEVRQALQMLPWRVAVQLDPEIRDRVRAVLEIEVRALLERYARPAPIVTPDVPTSGDGTGTPAA